MTDRHPPNGTRAVIVGNGPSVDAMPEAFWWEAATDPECMVIGTNRALAFVALQGVPLDAVAIRDNYRNLWHESRLGAKYHDELWKLTRCWRVGSEASRMTHCDEYLKLREGWQHSRLGDADGESAVMMQRTVVLMAANFAWLQGARELLLIGVDYHGRHARMIEPYNSASPGWEGQYDRAVPAGIERQFASARQAVLAAGGQMWNLSPRTRLRAVPHRTWNTFFTESA